MRHSRDAGYWNWVAERVNGYHLEKNIAIYKRSEHIKLIKKWYPELKGKRILKTDLYEEAFGDDHFSKWFLKQDAEVFGMDISYKIVNKARTRLKENNEKNMNLVTSDIRKCIFRNEYFDLIISNSTLDNLLPQDVGDALTELRRILKPEGILILTLDNQHNPLYLLGYYIEKILKTNKYYQSQCYLIRKAKKVAEQNKFIVKDITSIVHVPTPFNKLALLLTKINRGFFNRLIRYFIRMFSKLGNKKTKFLTGWFIALKLVKKEFKGSFEQ